MRCIMCGNEFADYNNFDDVELCRKCHFQIKDDVTTVANRDEVRAIERLIEEDNLIA